MLMKKALLLTLMALFIATAASADFTNGGFEDGTFTGWTKGGGTWTADTAGTVINYYPTGDPGKSAIVTNGLDYYSNNNLSTVPNASYGTYSARVNNYDPNYHYSTLSQTNTWTSSHMYFAWAAVLEEPSNKHPESAAPKFSIKLYDNDTSTTLYEVSFDVYNGGSVTTWLKGRVVSGNQWYYSPWQIVDLDTSGVSGDSLTLTVAAYDCGWGGHGGYAYVDGFSYIAPPPVPVPSTILLLGSGLLGLIGIRRRLS
jgi:hypothetical protein